MTATVTRHVAQTAPASSIAEIRTVAVTLPRLRCLEAAPEPVADRPVWRGPPKMIEAVALPVGSRVSSPSAAMRATAIRVAAADAARAQLEAEARAAAQAERAAEAARRAAARQRATDARAAALTVGALRAPSPWSKHRAATDAVLLACRASDLTEGELIGDTRLDRVERPRQALMWLLTMVCGKSLPEVGQIVGRDHTTVLHARRKVEAAIERAAIAYNDATPVAELVARIVEAMGRQAARGTDKLLARHAPTLTP